MWDKFLRSQEELDEDLRTKKKEFEKNLTKINKDIKGKLGKYDEKTKDMLKNLIKSNKNDFMKNFDDFREGFEKELEKEKELLKEEYNHEIKKY